jgi:hypothetical protein
MTVFEITNARKEDPGRLHTLTGYFVDGMMLLPVVWLFPVAILVLGSPVALLLRVLIEIATRWSPAPNS